MRFWLVILLCMAASVRAAEPLPEAPFLWQLNVGGVTHYLQGTIHALPLRLRALPPGLLAAREQVDVIAVEALLEASTPRDLTNVVASLTETDKLGLRARVGPEWFARFEKAVRAQGLEVERFHRLRPWFAANMLSAFAELEVGHSLLNGVDYQIFNLSRREKRIVALESDDAHRAIESGLPDAVSMEMFRHTLEELEAPDHSPDRLAELWRRNDQAGMQALAARVRRDSPGFYSRFIAERNAAWQPRLLKMLRSDQPHLIMAGALHMPGPQGLLAMLGRAGYRPQPFSPAPPSAP